MHLIPLKQKQAKEFINKHHRHHNASLGDVFRIGLVNNKKLIGCIMVGRPVAKSLDDGLTLEVTRCCVLDNHKNACSMLYGAAARVAKNLGYYKIVTYTLDFESGSSLRAVGWNLDSFVKGQNWSRPSRQRKQKSDYQTCNKYRWTKILNKKIEFNININSHTETDLQLKLFE